MSYTPGTIGVDTWTVLCAESDRVRAVISRESDGYAVRDGGGRVVGRYDTVPLAIAGLPDEVAQDS